MLSVPFQIPRKYVRKTERAQVPINVMKQAAAEFTAGAPLREVSRNFNIDHATLRRFIVKSRDKADEVIITGYDRLSKLKCVFPLQMENDLARHITHLSNQFHGLGVEKCRALAFKFAKMYAILVPANWEREIRLVKTGSTHLKVDTN